LGAKVLPENEMTFNELPSGARFTFYKENGTYYTKIDEGHIKNDEGHDHYGSWGSWGSCQVFTAKEGPFWLIWGKGAPSVRHTTEGVALAEAKRLAQQDPGQEFFVVRAVKRVKMSGVEVVDL
jgi:hypothetical protein